MQTSIAFLLAAATATTATSVYTTAPPVYTTPATTASTYAVTTSYSAQCDGVYYSCIAEYTSKGQSPFFPECNSRRAACQAGSSFTTGPSSTYPVSSGMTTSAVTTSISYSAQCQAVYNSCIAEYTSKGQSPFFPECNSRRAACQAGGSYSTGPVPTFPVASTTTSAVTTSTSYSAKCQDVYNQCIASYTSQGQSPFFPECNSRRAACQAGGSYSTGSVPTFPVASTTLKTTASASTYAQTTKATSPAVSTYAQTTKASSSTTSVSKPSGTTSRGGVATYTGAATAAQAPFFGILAVGAVVALL